jgi:hypothetical protein
MNDNDIIEILEDGTIYHFDLDVCDTQAQQALAQLWTQEGQTLGFDFTATVFSLFVKSVDILSQSGWSTQELIQEVLNHSAADDICDCDDEDD